jgi:sugar transferase (PEP-CTERM system associated)
MALLYSFFGLYRQGAITVGLGSLLGRSFVALSMGSLIAYFALRAEGSDGALLLTLAVYTLPLLAAGAITVRGIGYLGRRASMGARRVLIVGTGPEAMTVASDLAADKSSSHVVVGFYRAGPDAGLPAKQPAGSRIFSDALTIDEVVRKHRIEEVIVAVKEQRGGGLPMDQLLACRILGVPVLDLAAFFERTKGEVRTDSLKASWLVYGQGFVQGPARTAVKRAFDIAISSLLLLIATPVMVVTAIAVKLDSPGPIIYRQERVGRYGRTFMCLKFRSMRADAEKDGVARWATKNDARVSRVGAVIRKMRIDELPQLVSVLRGEMSLVGPRPERPSFVNQLKAEIPFYDIRHSVKPGVTGWAQVRYSYGSTVEDARRKHQFDLYYVKNHSLFLDLLVLVETVSVVLFREGAQ